MKTTLMFVERWKDKRHWMHIFRSHNSDCLALKSWQTLLSGREARKYIERLLM